MQEFEGVPYRELNTQKGFTVSTTNHIPIVISLKGGGELGPLPVVLRYYFWLCAQR